MKCLVLDQGTMGTLVAALTVLGFTKMDILWDTYDMYTYLGGT